MSANPNWAYWLKLSEVKVFEAIALLDDAEPENGPPDSDDASHEYRKTLRLLLDGISDRSNFTPGTLNTVNPALHGVRLLEVGAWAVAHGYKLPGKFPRPAQIRREAPPPIKTVGSFVAQVRKSSPANWTKWQFIPTCELWKAVCLTFDIEPDEERHGIRSWLQSRRGVPYGFPVEFDDRLSIAQANVSTNGPIHPQALFSGVLKDPRAEVLLSEIAAAAILWQWAIPAPLHALATPAEPLATPEQTTQPQPAPAVDTAGSASDVPLKRRTWRDVAWPYVLSIFNAGQYPNAKDFYRALESKAGANDSPFQKGTGLNAHSLFVTETCDTVSLKTIQNAWPEVKASRQSSQ